MKRFFRYVEISTKITSVFPFFLALGFLFYRDVPIDPRKTAVYFAGMLLFDMAATTVNHYADTKTNGQPLPFSRNTARLITLSLLCAAAALGLYLVVLTDWVVLLLGAACFAGGIVYSLGPVPLSRQAYGELFSGFFYGLVLPFLLLYINSPPGTYLSCSLWSGVLSCRIRLNAVLEVLLLAVVPFCLTANIMLANNICDLQSDIRVKRYTLPYYLGKRALLLFAGLYYAAFLSVLVMVLLAMLPVTSLLVLPVLIPVQKNIRTFFKAQDKEKTFPLSIQNFVFILSAHIAALTAGALLP